ncbi:AraC family transcriptional regulator [Pseudonocardia sp. TRM90224]|uniref:AraC family transcriptional regulator n=1 Tax=Pseudonocardia sp. TRM90224 TaxID=2812678 RepID=UPI001E300253|nr:AraC family transcriptional regulator [Pseudonocardia sp. TRM90224]
MDALANLLDGPRGREPVLVRMIMQPPWSVRVQDEALLGMIAMLHGSAWVVPSAGEPLRLDAGAVAVLKGPDSFTFADSPTASPQVVINPGWRPATVDGTDLGSTMDLGVRAWGNDPEGSTVALLGCYHVSGEISRRLLDALPQALVLTPALWESPLLQLLDTEIGKDEPGQQAVLDRLFDLLLIAAVRAWFARPDGHAPAWYRAHRDPVVGRALRLLHDRPSSPWTVASLARTVGVSRGLFARRFAELVGEPPMTYLTGWRLALAADLLLEPGATLEAVARRVGYSNGFALSTAFKRVRGVSPARHRQGSDQSLQNRS